MTWVSETLPGDINTNQVKVTDILNGMSTYKARGAKVFEGTSNGDPIVVIVHRDQRGKKKRTKAKKEN